MPRGRRQAACNSQRLSLRERTWCALRRYAGLLTCMVTDGRDQKWPGQIKFGRPHAKTFPTAPRALEQIDQGSPLARDRFGTGSLIDNAVSAPPHPDGGGRRPLGRVRCTYVISHRPATLAHAVATPSSSLPSLLSTRLFSMCRSVSSRLASLHSRARGARPCWSPMRPLSPREPPAPHHPTQSNASARTPNRTCIPTGNGLLF